MESKVMQVFYGTDCLPYKDKARSVHYPIIGQAFEGASATTEIRFYVKDIGGVDTTKWIANTKLPSGKKGYKLLDSAYDSVVQERYVVLQLDQFYTQEKGDVYISLNGYDGGITLEQDENDNYILEGTPIIQATGSIKITMQYAVQINQSDIQEYIDLDDILAYITGKADVSFVKSNFIPKLYVDREQDDYYEKAIKDYITPLVANGFNLNISGSPLIIGLELIDSGEGTGETYIVSFISKGDGGNADIQLLRVSDKLYATFAEFDLNEPFETLIVGITTSNSSHLSTDIDIERLEGLISDNADDIVDLQNNKQDTLVSGVNLKTVNNLTLLGSGNIEIEGTQITIDSQLSTTSTNAVQNRVITNELQNVREMAEGKTNSFSVNTETSGNSAFQSDDDTITATSFVDVEGNTINVSELNKGDLVFTLNTASHKYKDRWLINPATGSWGLIDADTPNMANYATMTYVDDELAEKTDLDIIAPNYSNLRGYVVGDKVIYQGQLYTCNTAITTAEDFNSSHWTAIKVSNGFVDLDGTQTISGDKTFTVKQTFERGVNLNIIDLGAQSLKIQNFVGTDLYAFDPTRFYAYGGGRDLGRDSHPWKDIWQSDKHYFIYTTDDYAPTERNWYIYHNQYNELVIARTYNSTSQDKIAFNGGTIYTKDSLGSLGTPSNTWLNGYFSGNVYAQNTFNVINASDITNNTLTQEQYDLITNGKPTLISGILLNIKDMFLEAGRIAGGVVRGRYGGMNNIEGVYEEGTYLVGSNNVISIHPNTQNYDIYNIRKINNKTLPSYPTTNTAPQVLTIGVNGGNLSWEDVSGNTAEFTPTNVVVGQHPMSITITMDSADIIDITTNKYDLITLKTTTWLNMDLVLVKQAENYAGVSGVIAYTSVFDISGSGFSVFLMAFMPNGGIALQKLTLVNPQWYGTQTEYDNLGTYDSNTIYNILES